MKSLTLVAVVAFPAYALFGGLGVALSAGFHGRAISTWEVARGAIIVGGVAASIAGTLYLAVDAMSRNRVTVESGSRWWLWPLSYGLIYDVAVLCGIVEGLASAAERAFPLLPTVVVLAAVLVVTASGAAVLAQLFEVAVHARMNKPRQHA